MYRLLHIYIYIWHWYLPLDICTFFIYIFILSILFLPLFIRRNGRQYQYVIAFCALFLFLTRVILHRLSFQKIGFDVCVHDVLLLLYMWIDFRDWTCERLTYDMTFEMCICTEFDHPEVTMCSWGAVQIQLLSCIWHILLFNPKGTFGLNRFWHSLLFHV